MADNWYKSVPTLLSWPASVGYFLIPTFQTQLSVVKLNLLTTQFSPLKIQIEIMGEISCISAEISAPHLYDLGILSPWYVIRHFDLVAL